MQLKTIDENSEIDTNSVVSKIVRSPNYPSIKISKNKTDGIMISSKVNYANKKQKNDPDLLNIVKTNLNNESINLLSKLEATKYSTRNKETTLFNILNKKAFNSTAFTKLPKLNLLRISNKINPKITFNEDYNKKDNLDKISEILSFKTSAGVRELKNELEVLKGKKVNLRDKTNSEAKFDEKNIIIDIKDDNYSDVYKELLLTRKKQIEKFDLDDKLKSAHTNQIKRSEEKFFLMNSKIQERKNHHIDSKKRIEKINNEKTEQLKIISYKRKVRSKVTKLINNDNYFICNAFTQHLDLMNKNFFFSKKIKDKKNENKKHFDLSRSSGTNYYFNIKHITREHSEPTKLFQDNLSKSEMRTIRHDPKYYLQDKKYLDSIKYFDKKTLMDRLEKEDRIIKKIKSSPKFKNLSINRNDILNDSDILTEKSIKSEERPSTVCDFSLNEQKYKNDISYFNKKINTPKKKRHQIDSCGPVLGIKKNDEVIQNLKFNDLKKKELVLSNSSIDRYLKVKSRNNEFDNKIENIKECYKTSTQQRYFIDEYKKKVKENLIDLHIRSIKKNNKLI